MSYTMRTEISWSQTKAELADTFDKWGVYAWDICRAGRDSSTGKNDPGVRVVWTMPGGQKVELTMANHDRAQDNLRVLYLGIEAMRMNEKRGIDQIIRQAYLQIEGPIAAVDPYELLGVRQDADMEVISAAFRAKAAKAHPDKGGTQEQMTALNKALEQIKTERAAA